MLVSAHWLGNLNPLSVVSSLGISVLSGIVSCLLTLYYDSKALSHTLSCSFLRGLSQKEIFKESILKVEKTFPVSS